MAVTDISAIGYFLPIFAFLLVFIVIYALLKKTEVLGGSEGVMLFISFILASFFVVEASLVEFVRFSSAWFGVLMVMVFFIVAVISFLPWKDSLDFMTKGNWFAWVILGLILIFFIISSVYVFDFVVNWGTVNEWLNSEWFGLILLLAVAGIVSWTVKK